MVSLFRKYPRICLALMILLMCLGVCFLYFNIPGESRFLPPCIFRTVTGFYCTGCGSTRVLYSLLHGGIITALRCNVLVVVFIPVFIYSFLAFCINTYARKEILKPIKFSYNMVIIILVVVIVFWILRNIPVVPFSYLAPIDIT